ncbi:unnamed protein product [Staurois parvus]|uniref:Uncharacterized protein n=1 Tax=Staurois parvus TaxID=386267 RepID=A0ABN9FAN6_9NEOB|nr:unnamed protein product [Staurois parvus]
MWGDQRVKCVLYAVSHYVLCVLSTVSTLLCRAIQSRVQERKGENCIVYNCLPHRTNTQ